MFTHGISLAGGSTKPTTIICCTFPLRIVKVSANHKDAGCDYRAISKVKYVSVANKRTMCGFFSILETD